MISCHFVFSVYLHGSFSDLKKKVIINYTSVSEKLKLFFFPEGNNNTKPNENPRLSSILDEAKKKNIPIATLHGVLEKLEKTKTKSQTEFVDFRGPGGAYFIVKILSHNVVGAKMLLNTLFRKMKCKPIEGKSKGTLFEHLGCIITEHKGTLDSATEDAIAVGADDVEEFEADGKFYRASFFIF